MSGFNDPKKSIRLQKQNGEIWFEYFSGEDRVRIDARTAQLLNAQLGVQFIDFDQETPITAQEARMMWSLEEDTVALGMPGGNVNLNLGMEMFIPRRVDNKTAADMANGNLVYISGGTGNNVQVGLAKADSNTTAKTTIAMLTENIDKNAKGFATTFGIVRGSGDEPIDTSACEEGDVLYLSSDAAGAWTPTRPTHPNYSVPIGFVFRVHATLGAIIVRIESPTDASDIAGGDGAVWDDLRFPASRIRQGATQKPDFDTTNLGLLFPQDDPTEIAYIIGQFSHAYLLGSDIRPHIHFNQTSALEPVFKMDYRWYKNGEDPTGAFTTLTASTFAFPYVSGAIMQIASFPMIDGSGMDAISSILDIKIYRDDNIVTGDVLLKEFDIHYEIDSLGSRSEFSKG